VKYVFGVAAPVARLRPGNILEANSLDCFGNAIKKPGDTLGLVKGDNPLTGPFFIEGAEPGDTLVVHILDLQVDGNQGIGAFAPGFGALNETNYTPMLHPPLPEKIWFYPIDHASNTCTFQALDSNYKVKSHCIRFLAASASRRRTAKRAAPSCPRNSAAIWTRRKSRLAIRCNLPVNVSGGLFYLWRWPRRHGRRRNRGHSHRSAHDGALQLDLVKGKQHKLARFENEKEIMAAGIYRPGG